MARRIGKKRKKQAKQEDVFEKQARLVSQVRNNKGMVLNANKVVKKKKKKIKVKRLVFALAILLMLCGFGYYAGSDYSKVRQVYITGNVLVENEPIISASGFGKEKRMFMSWSGRASRRVEGIPFIKDATIRKDYINRSVFIDVTETRVIGYTPEGVVMDEEANIKAIDESLRHMVADIPLISGIEDPKKLKKLAEEMAMLPEEIWGMISEVVYEDDRFDPEMVKILMRNQTIVQISISEISSVLQYYSSMLQRFPNMCVFTYYLGSRAVIAKACE